jgi:hypothetical protein
MKYNRKRLIRPAVSSVFRSGQLCRQLAITISVSNPRKRKTVLLRAGSTLFPEELGSGLR